MLNPNLQSDLLSDHSSNTSFKVAYFALIFICVSYNGGERKKLTEKCYSKTQLLLAKITSCCVAPQTCVYAQGGALVRKHFLLA